MKLLQYQQLIPIQRREYTREKLGIGSGKLKTTALVTQDFTQIVFEKEFVQILIVYIYTYNKTSKNGLQRTYRHFVRDVAEKNDVSFVVGC